MKKRFLWFFSPYNFTFTVLFCKQIIEKKGKRRKRQIVSSALLNQPTEENTGTWRKINTTFICGFLPIWLTHSCPLCRVARKAALPIWELRHLGQFSVSQFRAQRFPYYFSWDIYFDKEGQHIKCLGKRQF